MDAATPLTSRKYRPELRYRRRTQNTQSSKPRAREAKIADDPFEATPLLERERSEERKRAAMTKAHRFYHRRQAQPATKILTVNVEVIATVDSSGNLVGQETKTQDSTSPTPGALIDPAGGVIPSLPLPAVPVVPAVPAVPAAAPVIDVVDSIAAPLVSAVDSVARPVVSAVVNAVDPAVPSVPPLPQVPAVPPFPTDALPVVPAVPPFPSGFSVPAYPWPSGVTGVTAQAAQVSTGPVAPAAPSSVLQGSSLPASAPASQNSVLGSSLTASSLPSTTPAPSLDSAASSMLGSASGSLISSADSSDFNSADSSRSGSATGSPSAGNTFLGGAGAGAGGPANTAGAPADSVATAGAGASGSSTPLAPPQVVGSVVGSLAGAALILAIILMLLRRHKRRRRGALQLTNDETTERAQPPMTQDLSRNNRIPSAFLNRFSGISRSTAETSTSGGERGFQRVSGRKLPSAFSEGMTSDQFSRGGTISGSSFYQDDTGTYGGPGLSKEMEKEIGGAAVAGTGTKMNFRPSPARTPVIKHPEDDINPFADPAPFPRDRSHLSPPQSPNPEKPRGTLGRSLQSADGSRSSKFTENV